MAIIASDSGGGGTFELAPPGSHVGLCNMVVDLGKQETTDFDGKPSIKHQIYLRWELPDERSTNDASKPLSIGKFYTLSLHEKATLRQHLDAWRGRPFTAEELKGFDIAKLLGAPALLSVTHGTKGNGDASAKVANVGKLPKSMTAPKDTETPPLLYDNDSPADVYDELPEWLRKKVDAQVRDKPRGGGAPVYDDLSDDVPFASNSPMAREPGASRRAI